MLMGAISLAIYFSLFFVIGNLGLLFAKNFAPMFDDMAGAQRYVVVVRDDGNAGLWRAVRCSEDKSRFCTDQSFRLVETLPDSASIRPAGRFDKATASSSALGGTIRVDYETFGTLVGVERAVYEFRVGEQSVKFVHAEVKSGWLAYTTLVMFMSLLLPVFILNRIDRVVEKRVLGWTRQMNHE
jgi:hypothetical protein